MGKKRLQDSSWKQRQLFRRKRDKINEKPKVQYNEPSNKAWEKYSLLERDPEVLRGQEE